MILFYGCWTTPEGRSDTGHYYASPEGPGVAYSMRRRHDGKLEDNPERYVPWGYKVDGGLAPRGDDYHREGIVALSQCVNRLGFHDEQWWSVVSWWDNSVDKRMESNANFLVDRKATAEEVLAEARKAFPQIFARFKYPLVIR